MREPFLAYCLRKGRNPARFTGTLVLCRPGEVYHHASIQVVDGHLMVWAGQGGDARLAKDIRVLKSSHLGKMLRQTRNDWRIYEDRGHSVEPDRPRFTGSVWVTSGAFSKGQLKVEDDIVVLSRHWFDPGMD